MKIFNVVCINRFAGDKSQCPYTDPWILQNDNFLKIFPSDYLRFYLVSINPYSQDDLNFNWDEFATKINSELIGNLGNLVNRVLGFTVKSFNSIVPGPDEFDDMDKESEKMIN